MLSRDRQQFLVGIVGKIDVMGDARAKARIAGEEAVHAVRVAGEDHHQIVALVLHHLQQDLDGLLAVVALVLGLVEVIGLVDEQHAAHRLLQHFLRLRRGVPDILADEIVARDGDEMALADIAEPVQDCAIRSATVVLPVPGLPVKLMCRVGVSCARPSFLRARSTSSSAAISRMRVLTGARPINSRSSSLENIARRRRSGNRRRDRPAHRSGVPWRVRSGGDVALGRGQMLVHDATPGCDPSTAGGF